MKNRTIKPRIACIAAVVLLLCTGLSIAAPPANDDCQNAAVITNTSNMAWDTSEATFDGPGHVMTSSNIWYCYTATCTGCVNVSLCGSSFDTMLAVYEGCGCDPDVGALLAYNDDHCGTRSDLTLNVTEGEQYLIEVGGFNSYAGEGVITISCSTADCPPANDFSRFAAAIEDEAEVPFNTEHATVDGPRHFMYGPNIWFEYTAVCTGQVVVDLCNSNYDTKVAVYTGVTSEPSAAEMIAANDDACALQSKLVFDAVENQEYLIEVGGFSHEVGQGVLRVECEPQLCPPLNDDCQNAMPVIGPAEIPFVTACGTFDGPGHCTTAPNVWYCFTASATATTTIMLGQTDYDARLAVYEGCTCDPEQADMIACTDADPEVVLEAVQGNQYMIEVGGQTGEDLKESGSGLLRIEVEGEPPVAVDLGDAPDSTNNAGVPMTAYPAAVQANFPTVYNDGTGVGPYGPIHFNPEAVANLGPMITQEIEADIGPDQDGVNNITPQADAADQDGADDGVVFPVTMTHCKWSTLNYTVNVAAPCTGLWVNVWCDWNRDGDWDDDANSDPMLTCPKGGVPEWAVQNQYLFNLTPGVKHVTTPAFLCWHPAGTPEPMWMRITLSERPWAGGSAPGTTGNAGSGPAEGYTIGETEDYYFVPETEPEPGCPMCEDLNADGLIDVQDLVLYVSQWLEECI